MSHSFEGHGSDRMSPTRRNPDEALMYRLLLHVVTDMFALGHMSESDLRCHLMELGYTDTQIGAEVAMLTGRAV